MKDTDIVCLFLLPFISPAPTRRYLQAKLSLPTDSIQGTHFLLRWLSYCPCTGASTHSLQRLINAWHHWTAGWFAVIPISSRPAAHSGLCLTTETIICVKASFTAPLPTIFWPQKQGHLNSVTSLVSEADEGWLSRSSDSFPQSYIVSWLQCYRPIFPFAARRPHQALSEDQAPGKIPVYLLASPTVNDFDNVWLFCQNVKFTFIITCVSNLTVPEIT